MEIGYQEAIDAKRHKEILQALENDDSIVDKLETNNSLLQSLLQKVGELNIEIPPAEITVETNQKEVISEISILAKTLSDNLASIQSKLDVERKSQKWVFDVQRNSEGYIEKIIALENL